MIPIEEGDRRRRLLKRRSTNLLSGAGEVRTHTNQGPAERRGRGELMRPATGRTWKGAPPIPGPGPRPTTSAMRGQRIDHG